MGASGRTAQIGFFEESTVGTAGTVDHFMQMDAGAGETLDYQPTDLQPKTLGASELYNRGSFHVRSRVSAGGRVTFPFYTNTIGILLKHALGSVAHAQQGLTTAYKHTFTPADTQGLGLTTQVGRPQPNGTVQAFTFNGGKISGWEFSVSDNDYAKFAVDLDFWNVTTATALAAASYTVGNAIFNFKQASSFKVGGTVSTTGGVASVAGGTPITTLAKGLTLTHATPTDNERFGLGNSGVKAEQIENDTRTLTGKLDGEFTSRAEFFDLFVNDTASALQVTFTGAQIGTTGFYNTLDIILPACRFRVMPQVTGPGIVQQSIEFDVENDGTNAVCQIALTNSDTTV